MFCCMVFQVRRIVTDTMKNVHPIYNIKALMIKRELERNPKLKNENWDRFLPNFKPKNVPKKKSTKKAKKPYTPFPPAPAESKIDKLLESGEYFLKEDEKQKRKKKVKEDKQKEAKIKREAKRNMAFIPPVE